MGFVDFKAALSSTAVIVRYHDSACGSHTIGREQLLEIMRATDESSDRSVLFRASTDLMISILSYLDIRSISQVDIAVSNDAERIIWLASLSMNNLVALNKYEHCKESMMWVAQRGIRLESLKVKDMRWQETDRINGGTLLGIIISSLRCIDLRESSIVDEDILWMARGCPCLAEICLSGCDGVTNASLIALGKFSRQLISMDIGYCQNITDEGFEGFADGCLDRRNVNVHNGHDTIYSEQKKNMSNSGASAPARSSSLLQNVNLSACEKITDMGISALGRSCPHLSSINLHNCEQITDLGISALAYSCPHLIKINISYCKEITDMGISALGRSCPHLSNINLNNCEEITDTGISALAQSCPHLSSFNISSCPEITDIGLSALAHSCPYLSIISLSECEEITDIGISALGRSCPHLSRINISHSYQITDIGLSALAQSCPHLSRIYLLGCDQITDAGLSVLAHNCHHLTRIHLSSCRQITDRGISAIAHGCHHLSSIDISSCNNVTDIGISVLLTNCPLLFSIKAPGCSLISTDFVTDLRRVYPRLCISGPDY